MERKMPLIFISLPLAVSCCSFVEASVTTFSGLTDRKTCRIVSKATSWRAWRLLGNEKPGNRFLEWHHPFRSVAPSPYSTGTGYCDNIISEWRWGSKFDVTLSPLQDLWLSPEVSISMAKYETKIKWLELVFTKICLNQSWLLPEKSDRGYLSLDGLY